MADTYKRGKIAQTSITKRNGATNLAGNYYSTGVEQSKEGIKDIDSSEVACFSLKKLNGFKEEGDDNENPGGYWEIHGTISVGTSKQEIILEAVKRTHKGALVGL